MYFFRKKHCISIIIFTAILVSTSMSEPKDLDMYIGRLKKTIVIDPGHGGHDTGTNGPDGTSEKSITFILARMIETELKRKYIVALTRTDDYWLDLSDRTSTANHISADLFISIHTGGSFLHKAGGMTIYYYKSIPTPAQVSEPPAPKPLLSDIEQTYWDEIQKSQSSSSMTAAHVLRDQLVSHIPYLDIAVKGMPLVVLAGANMPSILLEIGYLSNPADEKKLNNTKFLAEFVKGIGVGIDSFFQKKSKSY